MTHIRSIPEEEAREELANVYATIRKDSGRVANVLRVESLAPRALGAHYALYRALMFGRNPLTRAQRELIAIAVSQANSCHY